MNEANKQRRDELSRKINAGVDSLGAIDDETLAAVRELKAEESELHVSPRLAGASDSGETLLIRKPAHPRSVSVGNWDRQRMRWVQ